MSSTMQTSEVLNRAADLIEERGWAGLDVRTSEAWGHDNDTSPVCMEGAIIAAMGGAERLSITAVDTCPTYGAVHAYLNLHKTDRLYSYNDAIGRTASEVIEVLRACAVIEASRERQAVTA